MRSKTSRVAVTWAAAVLALGAAGSAARAAEPTSKPAGADDPQQATSFKAGRPVKAFRSPVTTDRFYRVAPVGDPDRAPYLGVIASPAQPALQKQLRLRPGVGLVVDGVEPGSPAAEAGLREFDVLHRLDDQLLINTEQFDVLVRTATPGREVTLTVIREGKPQALKATPTEREIAPLRMSVGADHPEIDPAGLTPVPNAQGNFTAYFELASAGALPRGVNLRTPDGKSVVSAARITIESDGHKLTVTNPDGRHHLKVEDKAGELLFEGPVATPEDLEKVPEELRETYREIFVDQTAAPRSTKVRATEKK